MSQEQSNDTGTGTDTPVVPNFEDPESVLAWWGSETIRNYNLMRRETAATRQRLLNDILDKWQRARKSVTDSEALDLLQKRLEELEAVQGLRRVR